MSDTDNNSIRKIHDGHRERVRKRFRETGLNGFQPHQIIELLLFYTCPRKDTNELAHILINKFGSVAGIIDASYEDLESVSGISENTASLFKIIASFLPIYYNSRSDGLVYDNTEKLKELFRPYFIGLNHEEFRLACLDNNLRVMSNVSISAGGPSSAPIEIRSIARELLRNNSSHAVIAHNHPNGVPFPSNNDVAATRLIKDFLKTLGVDLLDHIIVGEKSAISMKDMAYINIFD